MSKGGFAVVLDNYQDAPANSPLHKIIQTGLSEMPEGINVIIISRTEPPSGRVDTWAFERLISRADELWKENKESEAIQISEKAVSIYKGNYLKEDMMQPYTLSMRERLKGKVTRSLIRTGGYHEDAGSIKKAAEYYQKGMEIDNLCEEICQRLMLCYQRLGLKAEAITAYNRCCNAMSALINTGPSARTMEIYSKILKEGT